LHEMMIMSPSPDREVEAEVVNGEVQQDLQCSENFIFIAKSISPFHDIEYDKIAPLTTSPGVEVNKLSVENDDNSRVAPEFVEC